MHYYLLPENNNSPIYSILSVLYEPILLQTTHTPTVAAAAAPICTITTRKKEHLIIHPIDFCLQNTAHDYIVILQRYLNKSGVIYTYELTQEGCLLSEPIPLRGSAATVLCRVIGSK